MELHGNLTRSYCIDCGKPAGPGALAAIENGAEARCPACGGLLRPDVVWFGEMLPEGAFERAAEAAARADVFLSVGTSAVVYPAAGLPLIAKESGAYVAEINVERSDIAHALDEVVLGRSGEVLPALVAAVRERRVMTFAHPLFLLAASRRARARVVGVATGAAAAHERALLRHHRRRIRRADAVGAAARAPGSAPTRSRSRSASSPSPGPRSAT